MIKRYVKLYIEFFKINIKSVLIYDLDFIFGIVGMFLQKIMSFCIIIFIFNFIDKLKGWSFEQILFLYGFANTGFALWHCFFINTISLPYYIRYGFLDRFLLRPINPIFQIMTDAFDEDGWGELLFGVIILIIAIVKLRIQSYYLLLLPFLLTGSLFVYASISLLGSIFTFFTIGNTNLANLVMDFQEFSKYPITIYNMALRLLFTIIIPIGFASYYPSLFFITSYESGFHFAIISPIISIIFFYFVSKIWMLALKFYTSTGS